MLSGPTSHGSTRCDLPSNSSEANETSRFRPIQISSRATFRSLGFDGIQLRTASFGSDTKNDFNVGITARVARTSPLPQYWTLKVLIHDVLALTPSPVTRFQCRQ
jgi:hypothetical protein